MKRPTSSALPIAAAALASALAFCAPAWAQSAAGLPGDLEGVGIDQNLDAQVPADLRFTDENGRTVRLGDYLTGDRPVLLSLVYYRCPMLCNLVLDGMVDVLRDVDLAPGEQFEIVTVSIDPTETSQLARVKKQNYVQAYGKPETAAGWHFLTGEPGPVKALAEAVGFRYRYVPERGEYAHSAAMFVLTPEGRISRYLFGVRHDPRTVRLSLVEAGEGEIGSVIDQFLLYCYRYDAEIGAYAPLAWRIMRICGMLTVVILGSVLLTYLRREFREKRWA